MRTGIGLRESHVPWIVTEAPPIAWLAVHSEDDFGFDGAAHDALQPLRIPYPPSSHCVGRSRGSVDPLIIASHDDLVSAEACRSMRTRSLDSARSRH